MEEFAGAYQNSRSDEPPSRVKRQPPPPAGCATHDFPTPVATVVAGRAASAWAPSSQRNRLPLLSCMKKTAPFEAMLNVLTSSARGCGDGRLNSFFVTSTLSKRSPSRK